MNSPTGFVTSRMRPKNTRICRMPMLVIAASKLLGLEHGPSEVHEEEQRNDAGNDVVEHVELLYPIAALRDAPEREEPDDADREVKQVKHEIAPFSPPAASHPRSLALRHSKARCAGRKRRVRICQRTPRNAQPF